MATEVVALASKQLLEQVLGGRFLVAYAGSTPHSSAHLRSGSSYHWIAIVTPGLTPYFPGDYLHLHSGSHGRDRSGILGQRGELSRAFRLLPPGLWSLPPVTKRTITEPRATQRPVGQLTIDIHTLSTQPPPPTGQWRQRALTPAFQAGGPRTAELSLSRIF